MFNKNTVAKAKLVYNAKLRMYKLVCAFNVTQRSATTNKLLFPVQAKCAYVSGDILLEDVPSTLAYASKVIGTNNIEFEG